MREELTKKISRKRQNTSIYVRKQQVVLDRLKKGIEEIRKKYDRIFSVVLYCHFQFPRLDFVEHLS